MEQFILICSTELDWTELSCTSEWVWCTAPIFIESNSMQAFIIYPWIKWKCSFIFPFWYLSMIPPLVIFSFWFKQHPHLTLKLIKIKLIKLNCAKYLIVPNRKETWIERQLKIFYCLHWCSGKWRLRTEKPSHHVRTALPRPCPW